ncbi:hypothetical protein CKO28_01370 [Rhodovibrio sodomensis]|uniref:HIRAN domain-containing protein n=1 Tax=Rhodovibrio sodomensis TaxID=1088 RepID=A0ABS1D9J2_9PROT|nr:hypothetical protein [Rhodovibrio sodomensis]MBK1666694.1 hypothetical protein [Rhodovibrio sodomensis]
MAREIQIEITGSAYAASHATARPDPKAGLMPGQALVLEGADPSVMETWRLGVRDHDGAFLGYIPIDHRRTAVDIARGCVVGARIARVERQQRLLDRVLRRPRPPSRYLAALHIREPDWDHTAPYRKIDARIHRLLRQAGRLAQGDPDSALELYQQAVDLIDALDEQGPAARAWRTASHPINQISRLLERIGQERRAIGAIDAYHARHDPVGLSAEAADAIDRRRRRLSTQVPPLA